MMTMEEKDEQHVTIYNPTESVGETNPKSYESKARNGRGGERLPNRDASPEEITSRGALDIEHQVISSMRRLAP
jgi:hypothetical protein